MTQPGLAGAMQGRRAGLVTRAAADLVDLGILWLLGLLLLLSLGVGRYLLQGPPFTLPAPAWWLSTTVGALAAIAYLSSCWAATGRTPGKQLAGLRLISTSGAPLSAAACLLRAALCVAFPLGLLWILLSRHNNSAQDLLVHSIVIYDWSGRERASYGSHVAGGNHRDRPSSVSQGGLVGRAESPSSGGVASPPRRQDQPNPWKRKRDAREPACHRLDRAARRGPLGGAHGDDGDPAGFSMWPIPMFVVEWW